MNVWVVYREQKNKSTNVAHPVPAWVCSVHRSESAARDECQILRNLNSNSHYNYLVRDCEIEWEDGMVTITNYSVPAEE